MKKPASRLLVLLLAVSFVMFLLHVGLKYVSVVRYEEQHLVWFEMSNRFDMNDENSVPQWFTLLCFLLVSVGSYFASYLAKEVSLRRVWIVIGTLALLLSIDDAAAIHESVLALMHLSVFDDTPATLLQNAWLFLVPVVVVVGVWVLIRAHRQLPKPTTAKLVFGGVVFLTGAIVVDSLANTVPDRSFAGQGVVAGIEGLLQMVGLSILVYTVYDYLLNRHGKSLQAAAKSLRAEK